MSKLSLTQVSTFELYALGITIVIGGQYFGWNAGLSAGFGSFAISSFLMGIAYICLCLCVGEVTSAAPFAGGSYGLARCTLGNHLGFFVGCAECAEYILYVATSVLTLAQIIVQMVPEFSGYEPIIWLVFFLTAVPIYAYGQKLFWGVTVFLCVISLIIVLIFGLGSLPFTNFIDNAASSDFPMFQGEMTDYMKTFPLPAWFFVGVESLSFAVNNSPSPKTSVPRAQIACILTLFATMILVLFVSCSLPEGTEGLALAPTVFGAGKPHIDRLSRFSLLSNCVLLVVYLIYLVVLLRLYSDVQDIE